jgi:hypothetical protein
VRQVLVAVLMLSVAASGSAVAPDSQQKIGVGELMQMGATGTGASDAELAQKLTGVILTERLSSSRMPELMKTLPGDRSRKAVTILADRSIFLAPPADEISSEAAPSSAATRQMLVKIVNYVNTTVRQLPNLMATRVTNGFEDRPREEKLISTGIESLDYLPLHWVGSLNMQVTYRDRQEVEDKSVKVEKKGNGVGGLMTTGEFGPVLSTVVADALKGKITWARWEKSSDGSMAVFHYQVPDDKSNYRVQFCCIVEGYASDGTPEQKVFNERSAYHGDIVFNPADGSIRLLTLEAELPTGGLVPGAGIAIEYAATEIGGHSYICPVRSVSMLRAHDAQQSGAVSRSNYKGEPKTFLNDVTFSNYRRFGSEVKVLTGSTEN